jgi:mRNA interferase MazF
VVVQRGEVWWAALPDPTGSAPGYRRPVLVVQADEFNRSAIQTVMVAAMTSNMSRAAAPGNVAVSRRQSGLPRPSVVNVSQVVTIDRGLLAQKVRRVPPSLMAEIDAGLRLALAL